mmetsp:Transcript_30464/g.62013  ORF Transcript_30464/g.62013 Transcript_30464/m.62013 type:complete len:226 (-) Transcript_30464:231-908(-)
MNRLGWMLLQLLVVVTAGLANLVETSFLSDAFGSKRKQWQGSSVSSSSPIIATSKFSQQEEEESSLSPMFSAGFDEYLSATGQGRLFMDFMTEGGAAHPVWYDETTKLAVLLGGCINGEVRIRESAAPSPGSKLGRLRSAAVNYDSRMNIYSNNCRIFCAKMQREVERLNAENEAQGANDDGGGESLGARAAESRLAFAIARSALLPMLYPASALIMVFVGLTHQ